jgi:hypothetical protein
MIYTFKNNNTGEIEEHTMKLAEYDDFKMKNPHLERYFTAAQLPGLGDGLRMSVPGIGKPDSTFEKYVIGRIKDSVPGNTIGQSHKTKIPKEF